MALSAVRGRGSDSCNEQRDAARGGDRRRKSDALSTEPTLVRAHGPPQRVQQRVGAEPSELALIVAAQNAHRLLRRSLSHPSSRRDGGGRGPDGYRASSGLQVSQLRTICSSNCAQYRGRKHKMHRWRVRWAVGMDLDMTDVFSDIERVFNFWIAKLSLACFHSLPHERRFSTGRVSCKEQRRRHEQSPHRREQVACLAAGQQSQPRGGSQRHGSCRMVRNLRSIDRVPARPPGRTKSGQSAKMSKTNTPGGKMGKRCRCGACCVCGMETDESTQRTERIERMEGRATHPTPPTHSSHQCSAPAGMRCTALRRVPLINTAY